MASPIAASGPDRTGETMHGKRLPILLGLACLPVLALGPAQTAQASVTHISAKASATSTLEDPAIGQSQSSEAEQPEAVATHTPGHRRW
jgi:hypothetical protein